MKYNAKEFLSIFLCQRIMFCLIFAENGKEYSILRQTMQHKKEEVVGYHLCQ